MKKRKDKEGKSLDKMMEDEEEEEEEEENEEDGTYIHSYTAKRIFTQLFSLSIRLSYLFLFFIFLLTPFL